MDPRIGDTILSKYKLLGVLGRGGMGVVYEAEDLRLGRHVAIKVLGGRMRGKDRADERFLLEARAIGTLMHPHLVTLLDYDLLEDGQPAMVMERVHGVSLKALMASRTFSPNEVMIVLHQTLQALQACHERGIVHRDLKPENLLVSPQGPQGITIKVIDFGLTKLLADQGAASLTVNGQVFGSPRFMAPEQWLRKDVDGRTDLYALGLIGYCLVRGEHFITAQNPFEICRAHLTQARPKLTTTANGVRVPPELEAMLIKAADPDPNRRYASATEMLETLEAYFGSLRGPLRATQEIPVAVDIRASSDNFMPFDAAAMAKNIEDSLSIDISAQTAHDSVNEHDDDYGDGMAQTSIIDDFEEDEPTRLDRAGPVVASASPRPQFAAPAALGTAITRGDVERALGEAALGEVAPTPMTSAPSGMVNATDVRAALDAAPPPAPPVAKPSPTRDRPTIQVGAVRAPTSPRALPLGLPVWMWLVGSVLVAVVIGAVLARFVA